MKALGLIGALVLTGMSALAASPKSFVASPHCSFVDKNGVTTSLYVQESGKAKIGNEIVIYAGVIDQTYLREQIVDIRGNQYVRIFETDSMILTLTPNASQSIYNPNTSLTGEIYLKVSKPNLNQVTKDVACEFPYSTGD